MEIDKSKIRTFLLFEFQKGRNASEAYRNLCAMFGENVFARSSCYEWFARFKNNDFSLEDKPRSGRPSVIDNDRLSEMVERKPEYTTHELGEELGVSHTTAWNHLRELGLTSKLSEYLPRKLTDPQKHNRVAACITLSERQQNEPFLDRLVTCDETWIHYDNPVRRRVWSEPGTSLATTVKPSISDPKVQWCVWWDIRGIIHHELVPRGRSIDSALYRQQLERVEEKLKKTRPSLVNRKGVSFLQDNAPPHRQIMTQKKIFDSKWDIIEYPAYSMDLAPSDYHLFWHLKNFLRGKKMDSLEDVEREIESFIDSCPKDFFKKGIYALVERWSKVIATHGEYIRD